MADFALGHDHAALRDQNDELARFRERFYLKPGRIYLDGNSLGLASRDAEAAIFKAVESWKEHAIDGWSTGDRPWYWMAEQLGALEADLVGAKAEEVMVTGTTTVNLHSLVSTFYHPSGRRTKIVADELDFPTDIYALQSQIRLHGLNPSEHLILVPSRDGRTLNEDDLIAAMGEEVALVLLPSVLYRSGQLLDMERLTRAAHGFGIPIGFDCCHSVGSVPHRLHDWGVDFAFWCGYKYLNGGPGATGSLFVHERHFGTSPGLAGWFGSDKDRQFDMALEFMQSSTAGAWQISSPPIFAAASLFGSLQMFREAGIDRLRAKSLNQTAYLMFLIDEVLIKPFGFSIGNPREVARRGGHVALEHPDAVRICKALRTRGVVPDYRQPNVIRLAPIPLYSTYEEIWRTVEIIREIMQTGEHMQYSAERNTIA